MQTSSYLSEFSMVATTFSGLEEVLSEEIRKIGGKKVEIRKRAVSFKGDIELMYKANLWLRSALRVLVPLSTFSAKNEHQLYKGIKNIPWHNHLNIYQTFAIDHAVFSPFFKHSQYAALKTKDAIVDLFRAKTGKRPSIDTKSPDIRINLHISRDIVTVSLDSSGDPLFKRGYRKGNHQAPLNEVLAAGMILISGWDGNSNFIDPMCGSGTLPIEAALMAMNIPPGVQRREYGFMNWKNYQADIWKRLKSESIRAKKPLTVKIEGSDISEKNLKIARLCLSQARLEGKVSLEVLPIEKKSPPPGGGIMITNPPYGERLSPPDLHALYKNIGDTLKQSYPGYSGWIISSNAEAMKKIGLRPDKKLSLYNGALNCRFHKFTIYAGSKR